MAKHFTWQWLKREWIENVPEDIALCEFDCHKGQCTYGEWASCERRISMTQNLSSGDKARRGRRGQGGGLRKQSPKKAKC